MQFKDIFFMSCFRMIPFNIYLCVFVCTAKSIGDISVLSVSLLPLPLPYFSSSCTFSSPSPSSPLFSLSLLVVFTLFLVIFPSYWMWIRKSLWKESLLNWIHRLCFFLTPSLSSLIQGLRNYLTTSWGCLFPKYKQII